MADEPGGEAANRPDDDGNGDGGTPTVPTVDLDLYQLSVSVSGQAEDELTDVEETARRLMEYLVDQAERLEERPDERGLG
ncbi:MAG: hypothetical protein ABEH78_06470 [Haloferacaceae archaeon]